ncbi:MAG: InlB B-repeat-containing protein [Clostridia bacterium]|nr:InlB B-repeat-containing protein [Clostridia bacterium]
MEVPTPSKEYYVFDGWYADKDFTQQVDELILGESDYTVYAKWDISSSAKYLISYENDGEINSNPTFYYIVSRDIKLNSPERKGYKFIAWYEKLDDGSSIKNDLISSGSEGNKTFIAEWEVITYTISFDLCEGKFDNDYSTSLEYTIEDEDIEIPVPVRDGYEFSGWEEYGKNLGKNYTIESGSIGSHNLMAKWEAISYNINLNLNGGEIAIDIPPTYTVASNIHLPQPTKTGYDFIGWLVNGEDCGIDYTIGNGCTGSLIIEAQWQEVSYNITYNLKGAINSEEFPTTYTVSSEDKHIPMPIYRGYHFIEWKDSNGESLGAEYVIPSGSHEDIELTAHRENNEYTIYYSANNGTGEIKSEPEYVTYENPKPAADCTFSCLGYSFNGWKALGADAEGQLFEENFDMSQLIAEHNATIILSVEWRANIYEVVFDPNDGKGQMPTFNYQYREDDKFAVLPQNTFIYPGNNFRGWAFTPNGEVEFVDEQEVGNEVLNGNIDFGAKTTLYAKWTEKDNKLSFDYVIIGYKIDHDEVIDHVTYGQEGIIISSPTKDANAFGGWYYKDVKIAFGQYEGNKYNSGEIINRFGMMEGETGEKTLAEFDAYYDRNEAIPLTAKWTLVTYEFTVMDEKDPANEKTVSFTVNDSRSTPEIRHDKFGRLFKRYTLSASNGLNNGGTIITSFTEIKKGTYATGVTPVLQIRNKKEVYIATLNNVVSEQYGIVSDSLNSYQIDGGVVIFDLTKSAIKLSQDFYVSPKISVLTIIGKDASNYTDFYLNIQSRSAALKICFENFKYTASASHNGITANSNFTLEICYLGENSITGASGVDGKDGDPGKGYTAGERAADGDRGADGTSAAYKKGEEINGKPGKKGADGKNGCDGINGDNGGNGCAAVSVVSMPKFKRISDGKLTLRGGDGGKGGNGGDGGRGQDGGNGGAGGNGGKSFWFIGIAGYTEYGNGGKGGNNGSGGNGGKGGNAGAGGNAGVAISYSINNYGNDAKVIKIAGNKGAAGKVGEGGACGKKGKVGDGGANGKGQWYGALATGGLVNIIVEACRNGGGEIGMPGDDTAKNGLPGAKGQ